ncbi:MAG: apolipoprotein N-acyltransferase [Campylobacterales bacterium]
MVTKILYPILASLLFSAFIYFEHFGLSYWAISIGFGVLAIYMMLGFDKKQMFIFGFSASLLWFYWIGFSFRYYDALFMAFPSLLFLAVVFGLLFFLIGYLKNPFLRILPFIFFDYIAPFGFDWMKFELLFVDTPLGVSKFHLASLLVGIAFFRLKSRFRFMGLLFLILSVQFSADRYTMPESKIYISSSHIPQEQRWDKELYHKFVQRNLSIIQRAIDEEYDLVLFPESAFPTALNLQQDLIKILDELSKEITIVAGALYFSGDIFYNSAYIFQDGEHEVAKKSVLVPFGESVPLPAPLDRWVNELFFGGASDFVKAEYPTDFRLEGDEFRVAICYEATHRSIYKDAPPYILALSNNAWFTPSIEPTLQRLLLKLYARKYDRVIFHSTNISGAYTVKP